LPRSSGYKGIDDYVSHLTEHKLESIRDGGQGIDDLGEYVVEYLAKIIGPDDEEEKEVKDEEEV
jgi:hypothetical protein